MSASYDHEALWMKARLFLNHAMDPGEPRTVTLHDDLVGDGPVLDPTDTLRRSPPSATI